MARVISNRRLQQRSEERAARVIQNRQRVVMAGTRKKQQQAARVIQANYRGRIVRQEAKNPVGARLSAELRAELRRMFSAADSGKCGQLSFSDLTWWGAKDGKLLEYMDEWYARCDDELSKCGQEPPIVEGNPNKLVSWLRKASTEQASATMNTVEVGAVLRQVVGVGSEEWCKPFFSSLNAISKHTVRGRVDWLVLAVRLAGMLCSARMERLEAVYWALSALGGGAVKRQQFSRLLAMLWDELAPCATLGDDAAQQIQATWRGRQARERQKAARRAAALQDCLALQHTFSSMPVSAGSSGAVSSAYTESFEKASRSTSAASIARPSGLQLDKRGPPDLDQLLEPEPILEQMPVSPGPSSTMGGQVPEELQPEAMLEALPAMPSGQPTMEERLAALENRRAPTLSTMEPVPSPGAIQMPSWDDLSNAVAPGTSVSPGVIPGDNEVASPVAELKASLSAVRGALKRMQDEATEELTARVMAIWQQQGVKLAVINMRSNFLEHQQQQQQLLVAHKLLEVCIGVIWRHTEEHTRRLLRYMRQQTEDSKLRGAEVRSWLQSFPSDLSIYTAAFVDLGFDSMEAVAQMSEQELGLLDLKLGHRKLLLPAVAALGGKHTSQPLRTSRTGVSGVKTHRSLAPPAYEEVVLAEPDDSECSSPASPQQSSSPAQQSSSPARHIPQAFMCDSRAQNTVQCTERLFSLLEGCQGVQIPETILIRPHKPVRRWTSKAGTVRSSESRITSQQQRLALCAKFFQNNPRGSSCVAEWVSSSKQPRQKRLPVVERLSEAQLRLFLGNRWGNTSTTHGLLRRADPNGAEFLSVEYSDQECVVHEWPSAARWRGERDAAESAELAEDSEQAQAVQELLGCILGHDDSIQCCSLVLEFNLTTQQTSILACTGLVTDLAPDSTLSPSKPQARSASVELSRSLKHVDTNDPVYLAKQRLRERARSELRMAEKTREKELSAAKLAHQERLQARERHRIVMKMGSSTQAGGPTGMRRSKVPEWVSKREEPEEVDSWESQGKLPALPTRAGHRKQQKQQPKQGGSPYLAKSTRRPAGSLPKAGALPKIVRKAKASLQEDSEDELLQQDSMELQQLLEQREHMQSQYVQAELAQKKRELEAQQKDEIATITSKLQNEINEWKDRIAQLENGGSSQSDVAGALRASMPMAGTAGIPPPEPSPTINTHRSSRSARSTHSNARSTHSNRSSFQPANILAEARQIAGSRSPMQESLESLVKRLSEPVDCTGHTAPLPAISVPASSAPIVAPSRMAPQPATQECDEPDCARVCHPGSDKCYRHKVLAQPAFGETDPNAVPRWRQNTDDPFGLLKLKPKT